MRLPPVLSLGHPEFDDSGCRAASQVLSAATRERVYRLSRPTDNQAKRMLIASIRRRSETFLQDPGCCFFVGLRIGEIARSFDRIGAIRQLERAVIFT